MIRLEAKEGTLPKADCPLGPRHGACSPDVKNIEKRISLAELRPPWAFRGSSESMPMSSSGSLTGFLKGQQSQYVPVSGQDGFAF